jgi:hypothetical protein
MKTIEFETPTHDTVRATSTIWKTAGKSRYEDLILKPEYSPRQLRIPAGTTWLRILPAVKGSRGWMLGIHALQHPNGRHAHGRSVKPGSESVFDIAYTWLNRNKPGSLFSGTNRDGFRLLTDKVTACWVVLEEGGKLVSRILLANGYDGEWGGTVGFGHQLLQLVQERDVKLGIVANPLDPESGLQVCVEKMKAPGAKFPIQKLRLGQQAAPIQRYLDQMDQSEIEAICPIEETVRLVEPDLEWELLGKVIGADLRDEIRAATEPRKPVEPNQPGNP